MASDLEKYLFRGLGTHGLKVLDVDDHRVRLTIAPWSDLDKELVATFEQADQIRLVEDKEEDQVDKPWDIISMTSEPLSGNDGRWRVMVHCVEADVEFDAVWPDVLVQAQTVNAGMAEKP